MRLFVIFSCLLALTWGHPLLKSKLLHKRMKERMFGVNTNCEPCGRTFTGIQAVQPMGTAPMPLYGKIYNSLPQLYGVPVAAPSVGKIFNSQEYSSGHTNHFMNVNGARPQNSRIDKRPAPVWNYASQQRTQVNNVAAASSADSHSSSTLWEHEGNARAASSARQLAMMHGGDADTFGAVPPVAAGPIWNEGEQYNAYSPLDYTGEVMDNSAAVANAAAKSSAAAAASAHSSASSWSQHNGNYAQSNGHGVAFAHASSASWSSKNSG